MVLGKGNVHNSKKFAKNMERRMTYTTMPHGDSRNEDKTKEDGARVKD